MKVAHLKNQKFLTVVEMFFSLLLIPSGLAFVQAFDFDNLNPASMKVELYFASYACMALITALRAAAKRYKKDVNRRRAADFVFAGLFLICAVLIYIQPRSPKVWMISSITVLLSLIPGRVFSILRNRKWYRVVVNVLLILVVSYLAFEVLFAPEPMLAGFIAAIMIFLAIRAFFRIMSVTFSSIRVDLLRDVVRRTYAVEIIFGLLLLILSFSWVLVYLEPETFPAFTDALWYCFAIVTTIGFGDLAAASFIGRFLSVVLGLYGLIVVALITSIIVNFYGEMKKTGPENDHPASEPAHKAKEETAADPAADAAVR